MLLDCFCIIKLFLWHFNVKKIVFLNFICSKVLFCFLFRSQKRMNSSSWKPAPSKVPGYGLQVSMCVSHSSLSSKCPELEKSNSFGSLLQDCFTG